MSYTYRRLRPADIDAARQLNHMFGGAFDDASTYSGNPRDDAYLSNLLGKAAVFVLVAEHEGAVVGGLVAYELEKLEQARSEIYIYDLAVAGAHRRPGIARRLIDELRAIAREGCAWVIFVEADPRDEPAIKLYESFGAREDVHSFDIPL